MKPGTLKKLDLLALARETELLAQMQRSNASIAQIEAQRGVLAAYRDRLSQGWRQGAVVSAADAIRALRFAGASDQAAAQMDAQERAVRDRLTAQQARLAEILLRRRRLDSLAQDAARAAARDAERKLDRQISPPPNPAMTRR